MEATERDRLAMLRGHPPEAEKVACVDFDGVLYPFGMLMEEPDPIPGALRAMRRLKDAGYRIVIFTSRLSQRWLRRSGHTDDEQMAYIAKLLRRDGIPFDTITAEKVPAEVYIDDKALRFDGDWTAVIDFVLWSREP